MSRLCLAFTLCAIAFSANCSPATYRFVISTESSALKQTTEVLKSRFTDAELNFSIKVEAQKIVLKLLGKRPDKDRLKYIKQLIAKPGKVSFNIVLREIKSAGKPKVRLNDGERLVKSRQIAEEHVFDENEYVWFVVEKEPIISDLDMNRQKTFIFYDRMQMKEAISFEFTEAGFEKFALGTKRAVKKKLAVIVDGVAWVAPVVQEPILSRTALISGLENPLEGWAQVAIIKGGRLPAKTSIVSEAALQ